MNLFILAFFAKRQGVDVKLSVPGTPLRALLMVFMVMGPMGVIFGFQGVVIALGLFG